MKKKKQLQAAPEPKAPEVRRPEVIQVDFENTLKILGKVEFDIQALTNQKNQLIQRVSNLGIEARHSEVHYGPKPEEVKGE
jgi:hypothetical protein